MPRKKSQDDSDKDKAESQAKPSQPTYAGPIPIPARAPAPPKKPSTFLVAVLCLLCVASTGFVFFGGPHTAIQRQLAMFFAAMFAAVTLFYGASFATLEGTWKTTTFRFGGPAALFIAAYFMLYRFAPTESTFPVNIVLEHQKRPLETAFHVNVRLPVGHPISLDGQNGTCLVLLPTSVNSVDLAVTCVGYRQRDNGPFATDAGVIRVAMIKRGDLPPIDETTYPATEGIKDAPSREAVLASPRFKPTEVTFLYKNATDMDLHLLILSWSVIHGQPKSGLQRKMPWMDWEFPASDEMIRYDKFTNGTGWFSFFVIGEKHPRPVPIGTYNLFDAKRPTLIVEESRDPERPFKAQFTKGE